MVDGDCCGHFPATEEGEDEDERKETRWYKRARTTGNAKPAVALTYTFSNPYIVTKSWALSVEPRLRRSSTQPKHHAQLRVRELVPSVLLGVGSCTSRAACLRSARHLILRRRITVCSLARSLLVFFFLLLLPLCSLSILFARLCALLIVFCFFTSLPCAFSMIDPSPFSTLLSSCSRFLLLPEAFSLTLSSLAHLTTSLPGLAFFLNCHAWIEWLSRHALWFRLPCHLVHHRPSSMRLWALCQLRAVIGTAPLTVSKQHKPRTETAMIYCPLLSPRQRSKDLRG